MFVLFQVYCPAQSYQVRLDSILSLDKSVAHKSQSLEQLAASAESDRRLDSAGLILHQISVLWHRGGDLQKAIEYGSRAVEMRNQAGDLAGVIHSRYNLAYFYRQAGERDSVDRMYRDNIAAGWGVNDQKVLQSYIMYCQFLRLQGDYPEAIALGEEAIRHAHGLGETYREAQAYFEAGSAFDQAYKGEDPRAMEYLSTAELLFRKEEKYRDLGNCLFNKANYLRKTGRFEEAASLYSTLIDSSDLYRRTPRDIIDQHNNVALVLRDLGRYDEALEHLNRGAARIPDTQSPYTTLQRARIADNRGAVLEARRDFDKALEQYQSAISIITSDAESDGTHALSSEAMRACQYPANLIIYLTDKARCAQKIRGGSTDSLRYTNEILHSYRAMDGLLDHMRAGQSNVESQLFWREEARRFYEEAIELSARQGNVDDALFFMEKSRAVLAMDALRRFEANAFIPERMVSRGKVLQRALADLDIALYKASGHPTDSLRARRQIISNAFARYQDSLLSSFPGYYEMKYRTQPPDLRQIRTELLSEGQGLVEYSLIPDGLAALVVTEDTQFVSVLPVTPAWQDTVDVFVEMLSLNNMELESYGRRGFLLYTWLIRSLGDLPESLVIVPDGILAYLPFDVLLLHTPVGTDIKSYPHLITTCEISYALSAGHLRQVSQIEISGKDIVGFAPGFPPGAGLPPLRYNVPEARVLKRRFNADILLGTDATRDQFLSRAGAYSVYHFATHAVLDPLQSEFSYLAFADHHVMVREIYALQMPAHMVVLSACQTASGTYHHGEGVMSMARAFTIAGAKSVVTSLWNVNDKSGFEIMDRFYYHLGRGHSKSGALRAAKLDFLRDPARKKHAATPFHWAAFVPYGGISAIDLPSPFGIVDIASAAVLVIALLLLLFSNQHRGVTTQ